MKGLVDILRKLVQNKKHKTYHSVYRLVKLALILPIATASVKRIFSAINFIKTTSRNKICDKWLQDCLVTFRDVNGAGSGRVYYTRIRTR